MINETCTSIIENVTVNTRKYSVRTLALTSVASGLDLCCLQAMTFVAYRPIFKPFTVELDTYSDFAIYRSESNKVSEEDILHNLHDYKKYVLTSSIKTSRDTHCPMHTPHLLLLTNEWQKYISFGYGFANASRDCRPEKQGKWQPIYGSLKVKINNYTSPLKSMSSFVA